MKHKGMFLSVLLYSIIMSSLIVAGDATLVRTFETWNSGIINSSDPAGLAYNPQTGHLLISDSEINEIEGVWNCENVFEVSLAGDQVFNTWDSFDPEGEPCPPLENDGQREPTGITYNTYDGFYYVTDDNDKTIMRYDDSFGAPIAWRDVPGIDAEGITSDPVNGFLYVIDGVGKSVWVYTNNFEDVTSFSVAAELNDAEGIAFNAATNHLFVVSDPDNKIIEYTLEGAYVDEYDISGLSPKPKAPQGLAFAPSSDPNDAPNTYHLYIADAQVDNGTDGMIYEVDIDAGSPPQQFVLNTSVIGSGSISLQPSGGTYAAGTVVTVTATANAGYQFDSWSGDLSGSINPQTIVMDADKSVQATFSRPVISGTVIHERTRNGRATNAASVTTSRNLKGVANDLYLAAISIRGDAAVRSVSGLGLSWRRLNTQCSGDSDVRAEVWMAQGTSASDGKVTAEFDGVAAGTIIGVSHYSGVDPLHPLGNMISGNSNGPDGDCSGGPMTAAYEFEMTASTPGGMIFGAVSMRKRLHKPGEGYTERFEGATGRNRTKVKLALQDQSVSAPGAMLLNGTFKRAVNWAVIGIEILPGAVSIAGNLIAGGGDGVDGLDVDVAGAGALHLTAAGSTPSDNLLPETVTLAQNYPNPFNLSTTIRYSLPQDAAVNLTIYNLRGQTVATVVDEYQSAGFQQVIWHGRDSFGSDVSSGVYFMKLSVDREILMKKITVQK